MIVQVAGKSTRKKPDGQRGKRKSDKKRDEKKLSEVRFIFLFTLSTLFLSAFWHGRPTAIWGVLTHFASVSYN